MPAPVAAWHSGHVTTPAGLSPRQAWSIAQSAGRRPRVALWVGSIRSGKTVASLLAWLAAVADPPRGGNLVVIARTRDVAARNLFGPLADPALVGPVAAHVHYTAGAPTAQVLGRTVHVIGASDARSETVLRGLTVGLAYVDELTLMAEPTWYQLLGRMSVPGARLLATTNPDAPAHWVKREVVDPASDRGYHVYPFRLADNPSLPQEYVAALYREYVGLWRRRFLDGEWVQAAGAVYDQWDPARHVVTLSADDRGRARLLGLGIDYGDTHPTRGVAIGLLDGPTPRLAVLAEWAPPSGQTQPERAAHLWRWCAERGYLDIPWTVVDPAAASFRTQLARDLLDGRAGAHGVTTTMRAASNQVLAGIRLTSGLLATDRLVVDSSCRHLVERLPGYVWDPKATSRGEDAPLKVDDHEVDALRYALYTLRADWLPVVPMVAPTASPTLD